MKIPLSSSDHEQKVLTAIGFTEIHRDNFHDLQLPISTLTKLPNEPTLPLPSEAEATNKPPKTRKLYRRDASKTSGGIRTQEYAPTDSRGIAD
jgi:hypothetical protein